MPLEKHRTGHWADVYTALPTELYSTDREGAAEQMHWEEKEALLLLKILRLWVTVQTTSVENKVPSVHELTVCLAAAIIRNDHNEIMLLPQ